MSEGFKMVNEYLAHHGVKGMKWGVRRTLNFVELKAMCEVIPLQWGDYSGFDIDEKQITR